MAIYTTDRPEAAHYTDLELSFVIGSDQYLAIVDVYADKVLQINELHLDQWDGLHQLLPSYVTLAQVQQAYDQWKEDMAEEESEAAEERSQNAAFYNAMPCLNSDWSEF